LPGGCARSGRTGMADAGEGAARACGWIVSRVGSFPSSPSPFSQVWEKVSFVADLWSCGWGGRGIGGGCPSSPALLPSLGEGSLPADWDRVPSLCPSPVTGEWGRFGWSQCGVDSHGCWVGHPLTTCAVPTKVGRCLD
jgi:hypothetical protein